MKIEGGCHCGKVRFEAEVPEAVELMDCNCSICRAAGFLHLLVQHTKFRLLTDPAALTSYRFGTGAANHLFCSTCGIKSFYQPRSHPEAWSVNWNTLDEAALPRATVVKFDGRNWERAAAVLAQTSPNA